MPRTATATLESEPAQGLSACDDTYPPPAGQFDWRSDRAERDAAPAEQDRLERRQRIRRRMAAATVQEQGMAEIRQQIAEIDRRIDEAADDHKAATEPLQRELATLEQDAISRIANRQPADTKADRRRIEIVAAIGEQNRILETAIQTERSLKAKLADKLTRQQLGHEYASTIAIELTWPDNANPAWLCELHAAKQSVEWANRRLQSAREFVAKLRSHLEKSGPRMTPSDRLDAERQLSRWQAELTAAENALTAANAECRRLHQEILDE